MSWYNHTCTASGPQYIKIFIPWYDYTPPRPMYVMPRREEPYFVRREIDNSHKRQPWYARYHQTRSKNRWRAQPEPKTTTHE